MAGNSIICSPRKKTGCFFRKEHARKECLDSQLSLPYAQKNYGWCEVNKDQKCVWVRACSRYKQYGEVELLSHDFVRPRLWELNQSSSCINFHMGRGHQGRDHGKSW